MHGGCGLGWRGVRTGRYGISGMGRCDNCDRECRGGAFGTRVMCDDCWNMSSDERVSLKIERLYFPTLWNKRKESWKTN
jgi:hypothetical protein